MYILGINAYHGDAAAAIVKDGELIAAVEEERGGNFGFEFRNSDLRAKSKTDDGRRTTVGSK